MLRLSTMKIFFAALAVAATIIGCGGGGGSRQASQDGPSATISWTPPETTVDNVSIEPCDDLDHYEIYVSTDGKFHEDDVPVALIAAVEILPARDGKLFSRLPVTEFDLNLLPNLPPANPLYVSIRAVGTDRQKSDFMKPVLWTRS